MVYSFGFQVKNEGYAAPYNPRLVELVFRRTDALTYTRTFTIYDPSGPRDDERDPRFWLAGGTYTISQVVSFPTGLPAGSYEVMLNLPDPEPVLRDQPAYSIRLVGSDWEASTGYNKLDHTIMVTGYTYLPIVLKSNQYVSQNESR